MKFARTLTGVGLALVGLAAAASPDVSARVRAVVEDGTFQTELPLDPSPDTRWRHGGGTGESRSRDRERTVRAPRQPADPPGAGLAIPAGFGGALAQAFAWVVLAALLLVLLVALSDAWRRRRQQSFELAGEPAASPPPAPAPAAAARDLESLVQAGRWAEAVHLLLQLAIRRLEHRLRRPVPPNLTSRELLRWREIEAPVRAPLETLVEAVELSLFGGLPMTRDDYRRCARAYEQVGTEA